MDNYLIIVKALKGIAVYNMYKDDLYNLLDSEFSLGSTFFVTDTPLVPGSQCLLSEQNTGLMIIFKNGVDMTREIIDDALSIHNAKRH